MPKPSPSTQKTPAKAKEEPKRAYTVVSPLTHDGMDYEPDEDVELTPSQAAALMPHTVKAKAGPEGKAEGKPAG